MTLPTVPFLCPLQRIRDTRTQIKRNTTNLPTRTSSTSFEQPCLIFGDHLSRYGYHSTIVYPRLTRAISCSMRLINIDAFLRRERSFHLGRHVDHRTKVLELREAETTDYAILSHRWIDSMEIDYEEMVDLAKMDRQERNEIRGRLGYKKIVDTCKQAKQDGYEWTWVDTCCIDKRSSAELSESINSMYRWYAKAKICYGYLHDVNGSSFPTKKDNRKYLKSNGWPEWFSRGWSLQEMIAPRVLQFFNKYWQPIGDKKDLAQTLERITGVPQKNLADGLEGNRPCVAQIISWAANRTTTRVEDRTYSLMGLLDVNMPMLYGEGKKAFHRLQLEIIRSSNDQSIFAWGFRSAGVRIGSILADDPSDFKDCSGMKLMNHDEFIKEVPELPSTNADHFDVFPITNRGIHIWMLLRRYRDSDTVFKAYLPCWHNYGSLTSIDLVLWNSNYYRYPATGHAALEDSPAEFRQVYLRYQDTPNHTVTFDIDDSGITENGFICSRVDPEGLTGNTVPLTNINPFCVKTYSEERGNGSFEVVFGQCLGLDWNSLSEIPGTFREAPIRCGPDWALSMADEPSEDDFSGRLWIRHLYLPESTWVVRTYRVAWGRSKVRLRMEVFQDSCFQNVLDKWEVYGIEVSDFLVRMDHIAMMMHRKLVILFRILGVSCCTRRRASARSHWR